MADASMASANAAATSSPPEPSVTSQSQPSDNQYPSPSIPIGLHEAALDSPTFRCAAVHFGDQVDHIERWLESYIKSSSKVVHDILGLEETINSFLAKSMPPVSAATDGLVDPDYTVLALKRVGDGQRDWWNHILTVMRRMDGLTIEPIKSLLNADLRNFKDIRRALEHTQKTFDSTLARYVSQSKTKEPSSLREDAFSVYETRKAYLKASMDYCQLAPQIRFTLDKVLVRITTDLWRELRRSGMNFGTNRHAEEMDRIRGWSKEMETTEAVFKRELQAARRDMSEKAVALFKPSRELEDYNSSTVAFLGSRGPVSVQPSEEGTVVSEKQGWLFLRTITGKPARTNYIRRWYYCRNGIFGWLIQGPHGVLQGDEIGVLLCSARPAVSEERRFCFEVKTKSQNMMLQAETQVELQQWIEVFEVAKKHAFDASVARDASTLPGGIDPAFAITPASIPEFSAKSLESLEDSGALDRAGTLPVPGELAPRSSFDVVPPRRSVTGLARDIARDLPREEGESGREHAARIMQKIELHRRSAFGGGEPAGIAGLISASANLLPGYGAMSPPPVGRGTGSGLQPVSEVRFSSLAPPTLAKAPTNTFLSKAAVSVSAERAVSAENGSGLSLPTAVVANYWGSTPWRTMYGSKEDDTNHLRLDDDPLLSSTTQTIPAGETNSSVGGRVPSSAHRKTLSAGDNVPELRAPKSAGETFPPNYPGELRAHHPQFRLLFPSVPMEEKLVLVFNAAWSSTPVEGSSSGHGLMGSGRVYVTSDNMYFYGAQMGFVIAYKLSLDTISEVTAAPGKDCDFIFLHVSQIMNNTGLTRITIKTFLLDINLLHARLNLLIDDLQAEEPMDTLEIIAALRNLEQDEYEKKSPSAESWEEVSSNTPMDDGTISGRPVNRGGYNLRDRAIRQSRKPVPKLHLPAHPVVYEPEDMDAAVEERHFEISAKACFHVLFGDKSFVFPKLYFERRAKEIAQGPWQLIDHGKMRREFKFKVDALGILGREKNGVEVADYQVIDVFSDHITYVVTHVKTPWHLPHSGSFKMITKVVITHVAKSKCKLALYTKVVWSKTPPLSKTLIQRQALEDAQRDAEELADVATDQVRKLGPHSRTKRAIQVYGNIGQQTQMVVFTPGEAAQAREAAAAANGKKSIQPRTLSDMAFETLKSLMQSVATSLLMWTLAGLTRIFSVVNVHRVLLLVLSISVITNVVFTGREGSTWWTERGATKFMSRMGVGPNVMMSKAIYIADLDEAALSSVVVAPEGGSECYDTFRQIMNNTSLDSPYEEVGATLSSSTSKATARRVRRTRQRLGSYRHDLLVAMRVVNSIEKEMIQSEWENWLSDENLRCEQVRMMLSEKSSSSSSSSKAASGTSSVISGDDGQQKVMRPIDEKRVEALRQWHVEYCGSCQAEREQVLEARSKMVTM
ncbi:SNF1-interacting protein [Cytospora paraplurivora]|uniref:SNF1-interacting protein n=1 Tax=Cytospora paraplurivora TaxID=2898453 RepID=A0AAN9UAD6_9PEZI